MTTRTFKQQGQAYGTTATNLVAKIDGVEVFNGSISSLDQPIPSMPIADYETLPVQDLFSWTDDVDFAGTKSMEITVTGGQLLLTLTLANYVKIIDVTNPPPGITSGPDVFGQYYRNDIGENAVSFDPKSNVIINGVAQEFTRDANLTGQYYYVIPANGTLTATIAIQPGYASNPVAAPVPGV